MLQLWNSKPKQELLSFFLSWIQIWCFYFFTYVFFKFEKKLRGGTHFIVILALMDDFNFRKGFIVLLFELVC